MAGLRSICLDHFVCFMLVSSIIYCCIFQPTVTITTKCQIFFFFSCSMWHITIYTSSFFFLCSLRVNTRNPSPEPNYELTRQDSLPRSESRETQLRERDHRTTVYFQLPSSSSDLDNGFLKDLQRWMVAALLERFTRAGFFIQVFSLRVSQGIIILVTFQKKKKLYLCEFVRDLGTLFMVNCIP